MNRFLKVLGLLMVALFALVSSVDATLDHLAHSPSQSSFTCYTPRDQAVVVYHGELTCCTAYARPQLVYPAAFVHHATVSSHAVD